MKLACETCPWSTTFQNNGETFVSCRNAQHVQGPEDWITPDYWCSLHPAAPKPIYETRTTDLAHQPAVRTADAWEPLTPTGDGRFLIWRRIIGYTKGGE